MRVIGVDPSLANLAYATSEVAGIIARPDCDGTRRAIILAERLLETCSAIAPPLNCMIFIEGYSFASHFNSHQLGELGGVIRYLLLKGRFRYVEVAPATLKKFVAGKGSARKDEMRLGVFKHWAREFRTDHETDAFGLAMLGGAVCGEPQGLTSYQLEVVAKVKAKMDAPQ